MQTVNIKTYRSYHQHIGNQVFILNKGYNAGKPLEKPCPNCFVISCDTEEQMSKVFWICYALWKSGKFIPLLRGSVIPYVNICDAKHQIESAVRIALSDDKRLGKYVAQLQQLIKAEQHLSLQLKLTGKLKTCIAAELIRPPK